MELGVGGMTLSTQRTRLQCGYIVCPFKLLARGRWSQESSLRAGEMAQRG